MKHKTSKVLNLCLVAGARPNFMKIAPLVRAIKRHNARRKENQAKIDFLLVHTGQHYDYEMSSIFFKELEIPKPDVFLNVGSGNHGEQTGKVMIAFEKVLLEKKSDVVVVVGDVNSTIACSVTAKKLNIKVAHVEAGLRSFDITMPEEINRIVTDSISDYLFVSEKSGIRNLKKEGKDKKKIFFVGNIMIDTLFYGLKKLKDAKRKAQPFDTLRVTSKTQSAIPSAKSAMLHALCPMPVADRYAVVTLHRPSNVDDKDKLKDILSALKEISRDMTIYFPMHPRTEKNINKFGLKNLLKSSNIKVISPMSYLDFLGLWKDAVLVFTDSGGIQEETTVLGIPCFTIRENTERPITVKRGTNILVGTTREGILRAYKQFKKGVRKNGKVPSLWDGKTAERIVKVLCRNS